MKQIVRKYKPLYKITLHGITSPCRGYSFDKQVCIDRIMQFSDNKAELVSSMSGEYSGVDKYEWKVDWQTNICLLSYETIEVLEYKDINV